jgi:hypothetical protein
MLVVAASVFSAVFKPVHGGAVPQERQGRTDEQTRRPSISAIADAPCGSGSAPSGSRVATAAQKRRGAILMTEAWILVPGSSILSDTSVSSRTSQLIAWMWSMCR